MEGKNTTYPVRAIAHLKEMIQESARLYGDNTAFLVKDEKGGAYREITYGKFQEDIDALGTMMMEMGLKDKKIAITGENCYPWMVAYYATVNGVGVAVPFDKELNENEIHNLMNTATCEAVFFTEAYSHYFNEFPVKYKIQMKAYEKEPDQETQGILFKDWVENGKTLLDGGNTSFQEREIDPHEMKMILFTSGTTDIAKGVMLNHHNIVSNIMDGSRIVKVHETDRTLSILPIHHTFESTMGTGMILYAGASIAFCEGLKYIAKNMEEAKVSILVGVPLIFESR